ncbi:MULTISPECIES: ABC transporter ATP-binding protein [Paenibacillus]|uniref:ATP-binding cassette subfamily B protein n=1 Tax=Paenibacillus pabuli TaxID=1472 RepID=A0A855YG89_9BACL|nr:MULTISPECIES: ABC transporter ATP-binding protein [Paenibacillus]PWW44316.1 ATP-binding cassette subfamily B protein [Paenibacillus pabuli]PXW10344.1 ATP-binding cassette subfamily B protein [Paenibacillus taichungensis]
MFLNKFLNTLKGFGKSLRNLKWSIKQIYSKSAGLASLLVTLYLLEGFGPSLSIFVTHHLVDTVSISTESINGGFRSVIPWVAAFFGIQLLTGQILWRIRTPLETRLRQKLEFNIGRERLEKAANLPLYYYEDSKTYDKLDLSGQAGDKVVRVFQESLGFIQNIVNLLTVSLVFSIISPWLSLLLVVLFIPQSLLDFKSSKMWMDLTYGQTEEHRKVNYFNSLITGRTEQKEIRIFGLAHHLIILWHTYRQKLRGDLLEQQKRIQLYSIPLQLPVTGFHIGLCIYFSTLLLQQELTPGLFVALFQAIVNLTSIPISSSLTQLLEALVRVQFVRDFMEEKVYSRKEGSYLIPSNLVKGFSFKEVSFKYPGQDKMILDRLSFCIHPGERVALVGKNGSGKSTIVKLLLGLYEPTTGHVSIDDMKYSDIRPKSISDNVTAVFQDFHNFEFTLGQSIGIGDTNSFGGEDGLTPNYEKVAKVAELGGVSDFCSNLTNGLDTHIGYTLDEGIGLSGGQWQRIAFSRVLMRNPKLLILDEPTASLDPKQEYEVYEKFNEIAKNKTVLFISHRLGSARLADRIIVLQDGKIAEEGDHDELLKKGNVYSSMWEEQSQWYK